MKEYTINETERGIEENKQAFFFQNVNYPLLRTAEDVEMVKNNPSLLHYEIKHVTSNTLCSSCSNHVNYETLTLKVMSTDKINSMCICEICLIKRYQQIVENGNYKKGVIITATHLSSFISENDKEIKRLRRKAKASLPIETMSKVAVERAMSEIWNPVAKTEGLLRKEKESECFECNKMIGKGDTCFKRNTSKFSWKTKRTLYKTEYVCLTCMEEQVKQCITKANQMIERGTNRLI